MLYTPTYDHWSPARWAADAREKRCRIVWDEFCRLVDAREDGRLIPPSEVDSAWRLYLACQRDECTCVNPLDHGEACGFMLELNRKVTNDKQSEETEKDIRDASCILIQRSVYHPQSHDGFIRFYRTQL